MKLTVLGCRGGYPGKDEGCSGYLFQENGFNLLIDCGSGTVSALQNYIELNELDSIILSHYHADHYSDIGVLQHGVMIDCKINKTDKNLTIYGHQEDDLFSSLNYHTYTTGKAYQEDSQLKLGPFKISFLKAKHSAPCYALQIISGDTKVVYTADTAYFEKLVNFSQKADILLAECTLYPDIDGREMGHMNSTDAANLAKNAEVQKLLLTHLPNYGDNEKLLKDAEKHFQGDIQLVYSGLCL